MDPNAPSDHPRPASRSLLVRSLLLGGGVLALGLGALGVFLPLLPTTPFLLLAAACFARSSPRASQWLLERSWAGPMIREWRERGRIPRGAKRLALVLLLASFTATLILVESCVYGYAFLALVGTGLLAFLIRLPTP